MSANAAMQAAQSVKDTNKDRADNYRHGTPLPSEVASAAVNVVAGDASALPDTPETPVLSEFDDLATQPSGAQEIVDGAASYMDDKGLILSDNYSEVDGDAFGTTVDGENYNIGKKDVNIQTQTGAADQAQGVVAKDATTYTANTSTDSVKANLAEAATTEITQDALVDADALGLDKQGTATGVNEDGTTNFTGEAINAFATQNISRVIDTSTVAGKMLAEKLGEGNYVDSKATVMGQIEILTGEFTDPTTGEPKIPTWASGIARSVSRTIAFKGISGSAATQALATALIEATLPIAEADSKFFQTLTEKNLNNKQEMIINKANVLSKLDQVDLDMRTTVAVNNAKAFMEYDLTNLDNEQQAAIINSQSVVQSILEDTKEINVANRFGAEQQNEMDKFYDNLNSTVETFNIEQKNQMEMFNAGEVNDTYQFNSTMENSREQFYLEMQYNIDTANAKWRQAVTELNTKLEFEAAAADVKNILNLTTEGLNQIWDRQDSMLDYAWKEGENEMDREITLEVAKMELEGAQLQARATKSAGRSQAIGAVLGAVLGSDERLKTNIVKKGVLNNGLNFYSWDWTEDAINKGFGDHPTNGVMAQEAQKIIPDAVILGNDGYLRVDYAKVLA